MCVCQFSSKQVTDYSSSAAKLQLFSRSTSSKARDKQLSVYLINNNSAIMRWKMLRETQTLRAGRSNKEPKIFASPQTPFLGAQDSQNLISWRWSLPSPTDPVWWKSMHAISSYRATDPHTNIACPPVANTQTGPITINCTAKLSAQCKNCWFQFCCWVTCNHKSMHIKAKITVIKTAPGLKVVPFDRMGMVSYYCSIVTLFLKYTIFEIFENNVTLKSKSKVTQGRRNWHVICHLWLLI